MLNQSNFSESSCYSRGRTQKADGFIQYEQLSKSQLISIIKSLKRETEDLKQKLKMHGHMDNEKMDIFKAKLNEEMEENEKAVAAFGQIIDSLVEVINASMADERVFYTKQELIGPAHGTSKSNFSMSSNSGLQNSLSGSENSAHLMDEIIEETNTIVSHLQRFVMQKIKKNKEKSEAGIDEVIVEKERLQKLLASNQKERSEFMRAVANVLGDKMSQQLEEMSKKDLIGHIQKLSYRLREVQLDKKNLVSQNHKNQVQDQKKYQEMLKEIKGIKKNRSHMSINQIN